MLRQKFTVQVTTLPDCDDITRFDGIFSPIILIVTLKEHKNPTGGKYMIFFPPLAMQ
jgi:hypothetical protein